MMPGYAANIGWSWLFGMLLLTGIVLLIVLAVRVFGGGRDASARSDTTGPLSRPSQARQILDERYANGELTVEQYREQIRVLSENP